jgi:5'-nucleotidase
MMRPLLLCSNDDGIDSHLLAGLVSRLSAFADVLVVAPERQRSAASHAITLHKPLRLTEVGPIVERTSERLAAGPIVERTSERLAAGPIVERTSERLAAGPIVERASERLAAGPARYSLSGTPADCVYIGMLRLAPRTPALVISGINQGYNLGTDVFYSGTVAAAVEGALRGSVGIALSVAPKHADLNTAFDFASRLIAAALSSTTLRPGTVLNVNIPSATSELAHQWTRLGRRRYADDVTERNDPMGRPYYWIGGGATGHDDIAGSDCVAIARGVASITPMHLNLSDEDAMQAPPFWG